MVLEIHGDSRANSNGKGSFFDLDDVVFEKFEKGEKTLGELIERRGGLFREKEFDCLESFYPNR